MKGIKKILIAVAVVLIAAGCENTIEVIETGGEKLYVMNALLNAGDTTHFVYLSTSEGSNVNPAREATIKCYVNGTLTDTAVERGSKSLIAIYSFNAIFKEGDVVRLESSTGQSAETTVPKATVITKVDTLSFINATDKTQSTTQFKVGIRDIRNADNYYRILIDTRIEAHNKLGKNLGTRISKNVALNTDDEPLLSGGLHSRDEDDKGGLDFMSKNIYNLFSDKSFENGSYTLKVSSGYWSFNDYFIEDPYWTTDVNYYNTLVNVTILSMDRDTFRYIKTAESVEDNDMSMLAEPSIYPDNVSGGLGFVSVSMPAVFKIRMPEKTFSGLYTY